MAEITSGNVTVMVMDNEEISGLKHIIRSFIYWAELSDDDGSDDKALSACSEILEAFDIQTILLEPHVHHPHVRELDTYQESEQ